MKKKIYILPLLMVALMLSAFADRSVLGTDYNVRTVQKGETLYAIAKRMGWNYDVLRSLNPTVATNAQRGMTVWYPASNADNTTDITPCRGDTIRYTIGYGETLYDIALRNNTEVADIFLLNPRLTESTANGGTVIKLVPNSRSLKAVETVEKVSRVGSFTQYHVNRGETWFGISQRLNIPMEELIEVNGFTMDDAPLNRGDYLSVPQIETVEVKHFAVPARDSRELTPAGRKAIRDELFTKGNPDALNIAIILSTKDAVRRDIEFLKGWMLAVDTLKNTGRKIDIAVYDISDPAEEKLPQLLDSNKLLGRDVIIYTAEKDFPRELNEYGEQNGIYVLNLFDLYDESYRTNPYSAMMLAPSNIFYSRLAEVLVDTNPEHTYIFIGSSNEQEKETLDGFLKQNLQAAGRNYISVPNVTAMLNKKLDPNGLYVLCPTANNRNDIEVFLKGTIDLLERMPKAEISVVGRPGWLLYIDKFGEDMGRVDTYIPSRFYADEDAMEVEQFCNKFKATYGHKPQAAWPVFSYFGYDLGQWLMDNNKPLPYRLPVNKSLAWPLQSGFEMVQTPGGGYANNIVYLVHITPNGQPERVNLKEVE